MHTLIHTLHHLVGAWGRLHWYGTAVGTLLAVKLLLSARRRRRPGLMFNASTKRLAIHGVVTVYNEAPAMLRRCLESLLGQTLLPRSLTVIDDCSKDRSAGALIDEMRPLFEQAGIRLDFIRFPDNRGKRHGLAAGFAQEPLADVYLCVDSDTVLDQHAVAELAEPFSKRRVQCVTGLVLAHNRATNLLTRLIDMRYVNAFLGERVAYSRLGSVLCACGSLAMYRGWVVRKHVDDFLDQRFLGRPATFGDDRRLTYYCLTEGLSLIQPSAVGYTDVPERLGHYVRQQIRWGKSFIREGFLLFAKFRLSRMYWWLNLVELVTWVAFTAALLTALTAIAFHPTRWELLAGYLAYMCLMAWVRSVHYLRGAAMVDPLDRVTTFLAAPLYALLNLCLLLPLRLWSLATLRSTNWGTRAQVEVGAAGAGPQAGVTVPHVTVPGARSASEETILQGEVVAWADTAEPTAAAPWQPAAPHDAWPGVPAPGLRAEWGHSGRTAAGAAAGPAAWGTVPAQATSAEDERPGRAGTGPAPGGAPYPPGPVPDHPLVRDRR